VTAEGRVATSLIKAYSKLSHCLLVYDCRRKEVTRQKAKAARSQALLVLLLENSRKVSNMMSDDII
jgi:hypothetical protein